MAIWIPLLQLIIALAVLWKICDIMIEGLSHIAYRLHLSFVSSGAVLGILRASTPEFGVCVFAFLITEGGKFPDVGLSTVIACVIFNLSLLLGICLLQHDFTMPHTRETWLLLLAPLLIIPVVWDGKISLCEAAGGLLLYTCYTCRLLWTTRLAPTPATTRLLPLWLSLLYVLGSLAITGIACHFLVEAAARLFYIANVPPVWLSLVVLSVGISLPDLFIALAAVRRGSPALALSQIVGSNTVNILLCLGIPLLIHDSKWPVYQIVANRATSVAFEKTIILCSVGYLAIVSLAAIYLLSYGRSLGKMRALVLIGLYVIYATAILTAYFYREASCWQTFCTRFGF
jgi:cation:H+ antiporter